MSDIIFFEFTVPLDAADIASPVAGAGDEVIRLRLLTVILAESALVAHCLFEVVT